MRMWIKRNVVMLPTEKAEDSIIVHNDSKFAVYHFNKYFTQEYLKHNNSKSFHLYILSNEEIKKGDWVVNLLNDKMQKVTNQNYSYCSYGTWKKIIATTDKSLYKDIKMSCKTCKGSGLNAPNNCPTCNRTGIRIEKEFLYKIHQLFIEYFVEQYNKGNIITKVMVEYENKQKTINYHKDLWVDDWVLKINSDNTINIKPIKISKYEDLYKAIDKIREGHKGSAINFIEKFINTQKN